MEKSTDATPNIHKNMDAGVLDIAGDIAIVNHGTGMDQEDMARMGKDQVFKVWPYLRILKLILMVSAYLRLLFNILIFHGPNDFMGG